MAAAAPALALTAWLALAAWTQDAPVTPLTRSADGHVVVQVDTPGGPLHLALDTGAQVSALTRAAAERLALAPAGEAQLDTLTGSGAAGRRRLEGARLGAAALPDLSPVLLDNAPDSAGALDGFLGLDAFQGEAVRIDLRALHLTRDTAPACTPAPGLPQTEGSVGSISVHVRIDTGLAGSVGDPELGVRLDARGAHTQGRGVITGADGVQISARLIEARRIIIDGHGVERAVIAIAALPVFEDTDGPLPVLIAGADLLDGAVIRLAANADGACARVEGREAR